MICFKSQIIEYISSFAKSAIPQQKLTRIDWIDTRALILFDDILIWSPFNILTLLAITIGLISSLNILRGIKRQNLYIALLTLSTLLELLLFAYKWMPVSTAPSQLDQPYDDKPWTKEFKKHTNGHGSVYFIYSGDFDYMQLNTPSGHHIYQAHGYESVQPEKLEPLHQRSFNAEDYANAGISHISMHPDQIRALPSEWQIVSSNNNFKLFYNNKFIGKYIATDTNGNTTKLTTARETPSTKTFVIPQGTTNIQILETFHQKWKYSFDKKKFYPCLQNTNGYYSILIPIPQDNTSTNLYLKFFP